MKNRHHIPLIRLGLPKSAMNELARQAETLGAPILISMGSFFDVNRWGFTPIGMAPWFMPAAADSAGFTAMLQGGYRWSVDQHVAFIASNGSAEWHMVRDERLARENERLVRRGRAPLVALRDDEDDLNPSTLPFPWDFWAAMDFCCEQKIARNRAEIEHRMRLTIETYEETLASVASYWQEGWDWLTDLPRPMPTLQGRVPADYIWSARALVDVWARRPLTETEEIAALETDGSGYGHEILPRLVGVGSVCGRDIEGHDGVLPVLDALHRELPPYVKLHLFGVKGDVLKFLHLYPGRVESIDSMAWDVAARRSAQKERMRTGILDKRHPDFFHCDYAHRNAHMREWYATQLEGAKTRGASSQMSLFTLERRR